MKNPAAFPRPNSWRRDEDSYSRQDKAQEGATLLDYFAAKALQGILARSTDFDQEIYYDKVAEICFNQAKAMLKEREKRINHE